MENILINAYKTCLLKTDLHLKHLTELYEYHACGSGDYYKDSNKIDFYESIWMPSFLTGMPLLAFRTENDMKYIKWAFKHARAYHEKIFRYPMNTHHDLGFIYSPFSVALYKMTGDEVQKESALKAADELSKRFHIDGGFIEAWQRMDIEEYRGLSIIDCMMNIPLLFWAWKETGHTFYRDVAIKHADNTLINFIREDGSVYHANRYISSGERQPENNCGYGVESHWARGAAWGLYGFAITFGYTGDKRYLNAAVLISEKFITSLNEPDFIPVWDFRLPAEKPAAMCPAIVCDPIPWDESDTVNKKFNRDTSAAAISASGMLEIIKYTNNAVISEYIDKMLLSLCTDEYLDTDSSHAGILKCSNGCMTYTPFGDFFFMEALQKRLYNMETCW